MATKQQSGVAASLAAAASVLAAGACCFPLATVAGAAAAAGASAFLDSARGWLMPLSLVLIALAFFQTYRGSSARRPLWGQVILWCSAALVLGMFLFPQWIAVGVARWQAPAGETPLAPAPFDAGDFHRQFNDSAGDWRIVALLSPT